MTSEPRQGGPAGAGTRPRCHACGRGLDAEWARAIDVEYCTTADEFSYHHCADCDALSIHPLPADRLGEIYPPNYYAFSQGGQALPDDNLVMRVKAALDRRRFRRVLSLIGKPDPRVLDVGGGSGRIAAGLMDASGGAASATVVDLDAASIESARSRGLRGFAGRFEDFTTDERFDLVLMLNLIEHVPNPDEMLVKARSQLAPGGLVWIQTPNFRSLDARLFRHRNWSGLHCPRHFVIYSTDGFDRALTRAGFETLSVTHTQGGGFWAGSLLSLRRPPPPPGDGRPVVQHRAFLPLAGLGAGFDFVTRPLRRTSQVVFIARPLPPA